jgi:hypothetical protein
VPTGAIRPNDDLSSRRFAAVSDARSPIQQAPFAWQDGRRLWILDGGGSDWVLAELLFEPESCRYLEVRRSSYRWPREAAGALLSRTFSSGEQKAEIAARGLLDWASRGRQSA